MARQNKQLTNAFEKLEGKTQVQELEKGVQKGEAEDMNTVTEQVREEGNTITVTNDETKTLKQVTQNILALYEEKQKRETVEETHVRTTFLFRKDLQKRLDKLSKNKRGFKTMFLNQAIESMLDELEK